ncbi:MAG: hypothetical protein V8Q71_00225 [Bacilli bacterium]
MKKFNDFKSAFNWVDKIVKKGNQLATETIAEQVYKDSNEFAYRESGDMYKSGETHSIFKNGVIIERTPYVRRRYYEGGKPGAGNRKHNQDGLIKQSKNKKDYLKMLVQQLISAKKEV